jgi:hypothetical protein
MSTIINLPVPQQEGISPAKQPLASEDDPAVRKYPVTRTLHQTQSGIVKIKELSYLAATAASRSEGVLRAPKLRCMNTTVASQLIFQTD